jgi:hypothetical protein
MVFLSISRKLLAYYPNFKYTTSPLCVSLSAGLGRTALLWCPRLLIFNIFATTLHIWKPWSPSVTCGSRMRRWQGRHLTSLSTIISWYIIDISQDCHIRPSWRLIIKFLSFCVTGISIAFLIGRNVKRSDRLKHMYVSLRYIMEISSLHIDLQILFQMQMFQFIFLEYTVLYVHTVFYPI